MWTQVEFNDTRGALDISAVQLDEESSYMAEDTSFIGFQGEVGVFERTHCYTLQGGAMQTSRRTAYRARAQ